MRRSLLVPAALAAGVACHGSSPAPSATPEPSPAPTAAREAPAARSETANEPEGATRACLGQPKVAGGDPTACTAAEPGRDLRPVFHRSLETRNVLGDGLAVCGTDPMTGWFRDGRCSTGAQDRGVHVVCATMTAGFLDYTKAQGNDLSTPAPAYRFPGLKPGDRWCLCAARWLEAQRAGKAPDVVLEATHERALGIIDAATLKAHAVP